MNDDLPTLIDRIADGTHTEADLATLRRALLVGGQGNVIQIGKYNIKIGEGHEIRIGDTIYQGPDADAIQAALRAVLDETGWQRRFGVPFQAPPLPPNFVPRPEVTDALKVRLLTEAPDRPGVLVVSAIHGLGGIGKSILAAALCYGPDVQARFPDGILWATLGQQPERLSLLGAWIQALGDYQFHPATVEAALTHLRTLLHDKAMLLVVDDVWDSDHGRSFLVGGPRCRVLITTRRADVADEVGADLQELGVMTPEQSLALLAARLRRALEDAERPDALYLAKAVGYLPLALELAAVRVRAGAAWADLRLALEAEVAHLGALEGPRGRRRGENRLEASLNLSLDALRRDDEAAWRAFAWLGVLPEDAVIAAPMAATLWEMNEAEAADLLALLWNDALLLLAAASPIGERLWPAYRMHDLLSDMARRLLIDPVPAGLGLTLSGAHVALLERYQARTQNGMWHNLLDDGYIHAHLTWHLEQAGQIEMIHALLQEETAEGRNGWFVTRERLGQMDGYLKDVKCGWRLTESEPEKIGLQCRYALIIASINSLAKSIPPALLVALVEKGMWVQAQGLAYARQIPNPEQRAEALAGLIHLLKEPLRKQALREMWTTAQVIGEGRDRSLALSMLAAYLSEPLKEQVLRQALVAAKSAWHASGFAQAMTKLAPHLRESLLLEALGVAQKLPAQHFMHVGFSPQAEALVRLFPRLVELGHSDKALAAARAVSVDCGRARALTGLISHLTEPLKGQILQEALVATRVLDDDESRAWNFLELFFHVSEPQKEQVLREALAAAQKLSRVSWWGNPSRQERLLISLVPQLAELGYIDEALAMAQAMEGTFGQALTLTKLLPFLPEPLRGQTLQKELAVARSIRLGRDRAEALSRLISQLSNPLRQEIAHEALAAVQEIGSNEEQNEVLSALIPYLSKPLLSEALVVVHGVGDKKSQIRALLGIASHMPGFLLQQALVAVQETNDHQLRLEALLKLATRLPEPIREQVLQDALAALHMIQRADDRAHVLSSLAVYLPEPFLREALAAAQETQHEGVWAQLLWSLAPHLPEHLLLEALAAAREIENEGYRAEALAGFAVRLAELGYPMEALDVAREISDLSPHQLDGPTGIVHIRDEQWRAKAILGLAPHLPEPLLLETLVLARAICARDERARALSGLTPYLPESLRDQVSHEALAMAETIEDDQLKVDIFLKLMPWLVEPVKAQAMQAMLVATQSIGPISDKAMTLLKLVSDSSSQLPESMREQKLWEALAITRVLCDQDDRAEVLAELGPCLGKFSPTTCYDLWRETIHVSACGARMDLLSDLGVLEPVIFALGGEKAIAETFRDIQDVGRWWP